MLESLFEKRLQHRCFPVNIAKFLGIAFSIAHPRTAASADSKFNHMWEHLYSGSNPDDCDIFDSKTLYRRSHQRYSVRKDVLKNFAKFTGEQL